jgi:hypothetical protein
MTRNSNNCSKNVWNKFNVRIIIMLLYTFIEGKSSQCNSKIRYSLPISADLSSLLSRIDVHSSSYLISSSPYRNLSSKSGTYLGWVTWDSHYHSRPSSGFFDWILSHFVVSVYQSSWTSYFTAFQHPTWSIWEWVWHHHSCSRNILDLFCLYYLSLMNLFERANDKVILAGFVEIDSLITIDGAIVGRWSFNLLEVRQFISILVVHIIVWVSCPSHIASHLINNKNYNL